VCAVNLAPRVDPNDAIPAAIHMSQKSPYTANLCPLSKWADFAGFCKDFGESIG
jgi:hypothetical protein